MRCVNFKCAFSAPPWNSVEAAPTQAGTISTTPGDTKRTVIDHVKNGKERGDERKTTLEWVKETSLDELRRALELVLPPRWCGLKGSLKRMR
jgi:phenylpropionate dioxygenase-like ring-hydroxylating dioxygenase large terminal subunit